MQQKFHKISWEKFHHYCFCLAKTIIKAGEDIDQIVVISRGGLVIGRILSDFLSLPISLFTIQAYKEIGKQKKPQIIEKLNAKISGKKILLVDEIVDTGNTLFLALSYLKKFKPQKIKTAALFFKERAKVTPDFFLFKTTAWVIFPYEVKETVNDLCQIWGKQGISRKEIKSRLLKIGLPKKQVEYFL